LFIVFLSLLAANLLLFLHFRYGHYAVKTWTILRRSLAAFDAGLPTIVIMENGFTPLSKPHGEQFYACGQGTLLMLSPWEHHNEKRLLTAAQCTQMNLMALELCE